MELTTETRTVESSGMKAQRHFTIAAGPHMMSLLSGIYKYPIDALVREYLTNMFDAYVALLKVNPTAQIIPPILSAPGTLSSELVFKDFGIGMSFDHVWEVYAQYGNSTKNGSNDEVGGFGLGSKTAFCYNNGAAWTIESRHAGQKHVFSAFVGEDGIPNMAHVTTIPTQEHSGVTIKIPIRRQDYEEVRSVIRKYAPYYPNELVVEGVSDIKPIEYTIQGVTKTWGIRKGSHENGTNVIMGNVPYRVSSSLRMFFGSNTFDFYVPIGSCDIVPSRDDLQYTDKTKATLKRVMDQVAEEVKKVITDKIDAAPTEWDALVTFKNISELRQIESIITGAITYKGKEIDPARGVLRTLNELRALDAGAVIRVFGIQDSSKQSITPHEDSGKPTENMYVRPDGRTFVVVDDTGRGGYTVARALLIQKLSNPGRRYGHKIGHAILLNTKLTPQQLSVFFGGLPEAEILKTSVLKGIVPITASSKPPVKDSLYKLNNKWTGSWSARVRIPTTEKKYYYLPLVKDTHKHRWVYTGNLSTVVEYAERFELLKGNWSLYGIKTDEIPNFDSGVWVNLFDAITEKAQELLAKNTITYVRYNIKISREQKGMHDIIAKLGLNTKKNKSITDFTTKVKLALDARDDTVTSFVETFFVRYPDAYTVPLAQLVDAIKPDDINALEAAMVKEFPMLTVLMDLTKNINSYSFNEFVTNHKKTLLDFFNSTT